MTTTEVTVLPPLRIPKRGDNVIVRYAAQGFRRYDCTVTRVTGDDEVICSGMGENIPNMAFEEWGDFYLVRRQGKEREQGHDYWVFADEEQAAT